MIDFGFNRPSFEITLFYILFFVITIVLGYGKATRQMGQHNIVEVGLLVFIFVSFAIGDVVTGDFYNYQAMVKEYDFTIGAHNHGEAVYAYIIDFCDSNYFLFRTIVFGGASILTIGIIKRYDTNLFLALFYLFATNIRIYGYSRTVLAASVFFLGLSFFCKPLKRKLFSYLLGLVLIIVSYQFHHSIIILILLSPAIFIRGGKWVYLALLLLIPVISYLISNLFYDALSNSIFEEYDDLQEKIILYSEGKTLSYSIWGIIRGILGGVFFYYEFYLILRSCAKTRNVVDNSMRMLFAFVLVAIIAAISFYLMDTSVTIYYSRITRFLIIPMTVLIAYLRHNHYLKDREFKVLIILGILGQLWDFENAIKGLI